MTPAAPPLIQFSGVIKEYGGRMPLRVQALALGRGDRVALAGLDAAAAETLLHLVSGAALPDEGHILVAGQDTRDIATDTDWLLSLDRFGFVTRRAILLETLSTAANLALPLTAAIDPMTGETRRQVEMLADEVGLSPARLDAPCSTLDPLDRARLHLARALALGPELLLIEHATDDLRDDGARTEIGQVLRRSARARGLGWLACTNDRVFAKASGGGRWTLDAPTGRLVRDRWWRR